MFKRHRSIQYVLDFIVEDSDRLTDLGELTISLREFGWIEYFPAFIDEDGYVIDGLRRITVAETLGITPVLKQMEFGSGELADKARVALFMGANCGFRPMEIDDKLRLHRYLVGDDDTMPAPQSAHESNREYRKRIAAWRKSGWDWDLPKIAKALRLDKPSS